MNEGHPAEGNEGLFSGLLKKFGKSKKDEDVTEEIMDMVNEEAVARGVNFSQVLQEALMLKLNIGR